MKRLAGLDVVRGAGILCVVFLHSATFHYEAITEVDFDNPPLTITIIGFLLMWAGLFALVSSTAYAYSTVKRVDGKQMAADRVVSHYGKAGLFMLVLSYLYFVLLAPKLLDVEHGQHQYALIPGLIANGRFPPIHADRVFYSTALSMTAWNLLFIGPLLAFLLGKEPAGEEPGGKRNGILLGGLGTLVILVSLVRLPLYPLAVQAIEGGNWLVAFVLGFLVNKNNPILPYLGFGLFGASLGVSLARATRPGKVLKWFAIAGAIWLATGIGGLFMLPDTMLEREVDLFWYCIVLFQLGLFLLLIVLALYLFDFSAEKVRPSTFRVFEPARRIGTVSLSIFMFETVLSQILVVIGDALFPGWRLSINACLVFGALNVLAWVGIVWAWARLGFRYGMEWWSVRVYAWLKRPSAKMEMGEFLKEVN
ncbi:MAG: hypothetical protein JXA89_04065 [Anaerolineae bacterium]|nr:hypothetical protein [Anaerolineae bacterium]